MPESLEDIDAAERLGVPEMKRRIKQLEDEVTSCEAEIHSLDFRLSHVRGHVPTFRALLEELEAFPELLAGDPADVADMVRRRELRVAVARCWGALEEIG